MSIPRIHQQALISATYVHLLSELLKKWNVSPDELFWGTDIKQERFCDLTYKISYVSFLCTRQKNHPHPIFIGLGVKKLTNCRNTVLSLLKNTK